MDSEYGREQLHIDLSQCSHWIRMMEVWYKRTETSRGEKCDYQEVTIVFMPDIWSGAPLIPTLLEVAPKSVATEMSTEDIAAEAAAAAVSTIENENPLKDETGNEGENSSVKDDEAKSSDIVALSAEDGDSGKVPEDEPSVKPEEMEEEDDVPLSREGLTMLRVSDLRMLLRQRGLVTSVDDE